MNRRRIITLAVAGVGLVIVSAFVAWTGHAIFRADKEYKSLRMALDCDTGYLANANRDELLEKTALWRLDLIGSTSQFLIHPFREDVRLYFLNAKRYEIGYAVRVGTGPWCVKII